MPGKGSAARAERDALLAAADLDRAPFVVAWELTLACPYACRHCRADAQPRRDPGELTTVEALTLVDELARFGPLILVLTGGDPLARPDVETIAAAADARGLRVALSPSATARVTRARLRSLRRSGVRRVALSLDGPTAPVHDAYRGLRGSFARTLEIAEASGDEQIPLQVNTTVSRHNFAALEATADTVAALRPVQWSLFFLVPTGRADASEMLSAEEHESAFERIYDLARSAPFDVKVTEAPAYRRVVAARGRREARAMASAAARAPFPAAPRSPAAPPAAGAGFRFADGLDRPAVGIGDGKGFAFVSHRGDICPSGFLPLSAGNVRTHSIVDTYRDAPLFRALRDPGRLTGRCGRCEFRVVCGGSRARAFALTGDPLAEDPSCVWQP